MRKLCLLVCCCFFAYYKTIYAYLLLQCVCFKINLWVWPKVSLRFACDVMFQTQQNLTFIINITFAIDLS